MHGLLHMSICYHIDQLLACTHGLITSIYPTLPSCPRDWCPIYTYMNSGVSPKYMQQCISTHPADNISGLLKSNVWVTHEATMFRLYMADVQLPWSRNHSDRLDCLVCSIYYPSFSNEGTWPGMRKGQIYCSAVTALYPVTNIVFTSKRTIDSHVTLIHCLFHCKRGVVPFLYDMSWKLKPHDDMLWSTELYRSLLIDTRSSTMHQVDHMLEDWHATCLHVISFFVHHMWFVLYNRKHQLL